MKRHTSEQPPPGFEWNYDELEGCPSCGIQGEFTAYTDEQGCEYLCQQGGCRVMFYTDDWPMAVRIPDVD